MGCSNGLTNGAARLQLQGYSEFTHVDLDAIFLMGCIVRDEESARVKGRELYRRPTVQDSARRETAIFQAVHLSDTTASFGTIVLAGTL
jgi:hypothetical protein